MAVCTSRRLLLIHRTVGLVIGLLVITALHSTHLEARQNRRDISKATFKGIWPFTVATGTLGCEPGNHVVFTTAGKTYAVNGSARSVMQTKKAAWLDAQLITADIQHEEVKAVAQRLALPERKKFFADWVACEDRHERGPERETCQSNAQAAKRITGDEARLIRSEGLTLQWPPLGNPMRMSVRDVITEGLALCR